jgi:hypothetical protein
MSEPSQLQGCYVYGIDKEGGGTVPGVYTEADVLALLW